MSELRLTFLVTFLQQIANPSDVFIVKFPARSQSDGRAERLRAFHVRRNCHGDTIFERVVCDAAEVCLMVLVGQVEVFDHGILEGDMFHRRQLVAAEREVF